MFLNNFENEGHEMRTFNDFENEKHIFDFSPENYLRGLMIVRG